MTNVPRKIKIVLAFLITLLLILTLNTVYSVPLNLSPGFFNPALPPGFRIDLNPEQQLRPLPSSVSLSQHTFTQQTKLQASDRSNGDAFGGAVAIDGDTVLIGAGGANGGRGAAYVFVRDGATWTEQAKLSASDGAEGDVFGVAVAVDGDTAVIGAHYDDTGGNQDQGAAYVFVRDGTTWTEQAKLTASDGAAQEYFGGSVALDGDTALIGVLNGFAYVFVRDGTIWMQQVKLTVGSGVVSVALDGNTALIGSHGEMVGENNQQGAAYVFVRNGNSWELQMKLLASDGAKGDAFGNAVALEGNIALVGALWNEPGTPDYDEARGSVYIFVRSGHHWTETAQLTASDSAIGDQFGYSSALEGNIALIGAVGRDSNKGIAFVFTGNGSAWIQAQKLSASDGIAQDFFGGDLVYASGIALIGASRDDNVSGSVYVFVDPDLLPTMTPTSTLSPTPTVTETPTGTITGTVTSTPTFIVNTPVATLTSTPAVSRTPSPTVTNTPLPGLELLVNGGFEATVLDPWVLKNGTSDKIKCNKPGKVVAYSGLCAFVFKGGIGENSALLQAPDASGIAPVTGDTFDFSAYVKAGSAIKGKIKVVVKYSDGGDPGKFSANLTLTDGYQPVMGSIDLRAVAISKVKVQIKHSSRSGKMWIDEVSLRHVGGARLISLP